MARDFKETSRDDATKALDSLTRDQERFTERIHVPWVLMAAFGALSAWSVGTAVTTEPGGNYEPPLGMWMVLLGILVVSHLVQRESGVHFRSLGSRATWLIIGILGLCLSLFSISLGLVSSGMPWAVMVTSILAFGMTTGMAGIAYRQAVENIYRA